VGRVASIPRLRTAPSNTRITLSRLWVSLKTGEPRPHSEMHPSCIIPYTITGTANYFAVLTNTDPTPRKAVTEQVRRSTPNQPVTDVRTVKLAPERLGVTAGLASVLSYSGFLPHWG